MAFSESRRSIDSFEIVVLLKDHILCFIFKGLLSSHTHTLARGDSELDDSSIHQAFKLSLAAPSVVINLLVVAPKRLARSNKIPRE